MHDQATDEVAARQRWMAVLARASAEELSKAFDVLEPVPSFRWLRPAESGLVMVRARIGGSGAKFNVGEAAVTRCVTRTDDGYTGVSYVLGRERRRAELAALLDALLQDRARRPAIERLVLQPMAARQREHRETASRKAAATKVEFYTLARGEDD